jgi:hypothetical protein
MRVCGFCLIFVPFGHYDEPEILSYAIRLICSIGADVRQSPLILLQHLNGIIRIAYLLHEPYP